MTNLVLTRAARAARWLPHLLHVALAVSLAPLHKVLALGAVQVQKTVRRPSRLIWIPVGFAVRALERAGGKPQTTAHDLRPIVDFFKAPLRRSLRLALRSPDLYRRFGHLFPDWWFVREERIDFAFNTANYLLQHERPKEAWTYYDRSLREKNRDPVHYFVAAVCLFQGLGRFREALLLLSQANDLRLQEARKLGVKTGRCRVLDSFWAANIGHTATLDYVIKLGILEGRPRDSTILFVAPGTQIANRFLLDQLAEHLKYVVDPKQLPFPADALTAVRYDYLGPLVRDQTTLFFWELAAKTYRRWQLERRPPLLTFPREIEEKAWRALETKGVPRTAWFVGLHVREAGSKWHHNSLHQVLNADIKSYLPAIAEVTRRGGWVIRMGDKSMAPLPTMPNVFDYCHSELHSDWLDIFIAAKCRFFLGTSSGPAYVPPLYGTPSVLTNWWPPAQRPWHAMDIFLPKMLRALSDGRVLTLRETLGEPFGYCHSLKYLEEEMKVTVEGNNEGLILDAVIEMIDRLEASPAEEADICDLRRRADQIYDECKAFGMGKLTRGLLRKYETFVS
jgi:putative glycosyltransferase (TIGR04372 family)